MHIACWSTKISALKLLLRYRHIIIIPVERFNLFLHTNKTPVEALTPSAMPEIIKGLRQPRTSITSNSALYRRHQSFLKFYHHTK